MAERFMRDEITERCLWVTGRTRDGEGFSAPDKHFGWDMVPEDWELLERHVGYGARLTAPGYLDATEYELFFTQKEAQDYLHTEFHDDHHEPGCPECEEQLTPDCVCDECKESRRSVEPKG